MLVTIGPDLFLVCALLAEVVDRDIRLGMVGMVVIVIVTFLIAVPFRILGVVRVARKAVPVLPGLALAVMLTLTIGFPALVAAIVIRLAVGLAIARRSIVIAAVLFPWRAFLPTLVAFLFFKAAFRLAMILVVIVILMLFVAVLFITSAPVNPTVFLAFVVPVAFPVFVIALVIALITAVLAPMSIVVPVVAILVTFLIEGVAGVLFFVVLLITRSGVGVFVARVVDDLHQSGGGNIGECALPEQGDIGRESIAAISWLHLEHIDSLSRQD